MEYVVQITPYKTAGDTLTKRGLTPGASEMAEWLADAGFMALVEAVMAGRRRSEEAARKLIYLAITNAVPAWTRTRNWTTALLAFKIHFGERLPE